MIINSNFRDHYDSLSGQLRDEKVVYNRRTEKWNLGEHPDMLREFTPIRDQYLIGGTLSRGVNPPLIYDHVGVLLFCGKVYPYAYADHRDSRENFVTPYEEVNTGRYFGRSRYIDMRYRGEGIDNPVAIKLNQKYAPIINVNNKYRHAVTINPSLADLKFHLDVYNIYQSILSFLQSNTPEIPEISDADKASSRGFDEHSFRREKGGPTRKRKKLKL